MRFQNYLKSYKGIFAVGLGEWKTNILAQLNPGCDIRVLNQSLCKNKSG